MQALLSGRYDLNKVALIITQTGGGCRASNYIGFIRRALENAGMGQVPVISMSAGIEKNPGLDINLKMAHRALQALIYGDVFMRVLYRTRPYEKIKGSANALHEKWREIAIKQVSKGNKKEFNNYSLENTNKQSLIFFNIISTNTVQFAVRSAILSAS